jgi:2-polyprenyl-3-methyl-5-hydroxy-6-metoxy-1,4-benzoquinol methylase
MNQSLNKVNEPITIPVRLAVLAMRLAPRFVSPDDTAHAAFFEEAHLRGMNQQQIHEAMHSAADNRCAAEEATPFLEPFFSRSIASYFKNKDVLDFGCALGGTAIAWERMYGAKTISGFDVSPYFIEGAQRYAQYSNSTAVFKQGVGEDAPFPDNSFDTIVAIDVFEHVYNFDSCLKECWRMLKPGGSLILVFPPFLHPFEHHIKVSRTPFVHWIFSGETIRKALNHLLDERGPAHAHFKSDPNPNYKIPDLNGITCRAAWAAIRQQGWKVVRNECYGVPRVGRRAQAPIMRAISAFSSLFARVPLLEEVFLDRVAVILQSDSAAPRSGVTG